MLLPTLAFYDRSAQPHTQESTVNLRLTVAWLEQYETDRQHDDRAALNGDDHVLSATS